MKKLGFGLMRLPLTDPNDQSAVDVEQTRLMIDEFMSAGFNYFDTAYMYQGGASESLFGELVAARYARDDFVVTTKMPIFQITEREEYARIFDEQLKRCRVDFFDNYFMHALGKETYFKTLELGGFEFLSRKKAEGKIKRIGFSYHDDAETLERILAEQPEVELVQLQLNYIDWDDASIQARKNYEVCQKRGVAVNVMEPLKGGALTRLPEAALRVFKECSPDASAASWGIRYAASLEGVHTVLSGMSGIEQMRDNIGFMSDFKPLSEAERAAIAKTASIINDSIAIPCTACRYCVEGCPMNIAIPEYFALYNSQKQFGLRTGLKMTYNHIAATRGRASDCIECRGCEERCPQHLNVVESLRLVSEVFD